LAKTLFEGGTTIPKISVIIPVFNAEKYITQTLDSIKNQTVHPYQIVMVNDCSTDNSFKVAMEWSKQNKVSIAFYKNKVNSGIGFTRAAGVEHCETDYITYLSSDDVWHPQFLEKTLPILNEKTAVFSDYYQCDQYLKPYNIFKAPTLDIKKHIVEFALQKNMFVNFSNVVFPRQVFTHCNFIRELRHGEDLIFLLDTLINGLEYRNVAEPLSFYRIHPTQGSNLRGLDEWKQLWLLLKVRLLMLGVPEKQIEEAMKQNYDILYPKKTLIWSTKRSISTFLSKNKLGLKTKSIIKKVIK
jgi:teichuronic acid biosynthesis glycosyltransferase TuaG